MLASFQEQKIANKLVLTGTVCSERTIRPHKYTHHFLYVSLGAGIVQRLAAAVQQAKVGLSP